MRTFYIFKINMEYYKLTRKNPFDLYTAYLNIRLSTNNNIKLLFNEYSSITDKVYKNKFNYYLYKKMGSLDGYSIYRNNHMYNNYYSNEVSKLSVFNSFMVLKTNKEDSIFFTYLKEYNNIFIIDFENNDYFYLNNLRLVNE